MSGLKFNIRNKTLLKIIIAFIVLCFAIISIRAYGVYYLKTKDYNSSITSQEIASAKNASVLLSEILNPCRELLISASEQLKDSSFSSDSEINDFLSSKAIKLTGIGGIYFGRETDGKFLSTASYALPDGYDPRKQTWYLEAVLKRKFVLSEPYINTLTGEDCLGLAVPVYRNNILIGVIGADLPINHISDMLGAIESNQNIHFSLLTHKGTQIILPKYKNMYSYTSTILNRNLDNIKSNPSGEIYFKNPDSEFYAYYLNITDYNLKIVSIFDPSVYKSMKGNIIKTTMLSSAIQFLVAGIFSMTILALFNFMKQRELHRLLYKDVLTGLNNRNYLELYFTEMSKKARKNTKNALMLIDIDNFKFINDTLGHDTGDFVLVSIVGMLKRINSKDTIITRIGSDEFALFLPNTTKENAIQAAEKLQKYIFTNPVRQDSKQIDLSISIGMTIVESDFDIQKCMSLADVALKTAKDEGKNRVICLSHNDVAEDISNMEKTNKIISSIKNALKYDNFILYLQPIIDITSNRISHYEALLRLKDENDNFISPADFIPIGEKFGLISEIDKWVFGNVLNILKDNPDMKIFINLSAISLTDNLLLEYIDNTLSGLDDAFCRSRLGIEVTETAAAKNFVISEDWIRKFKDMGCLIAIDDFGVGYTSFSYLRSLPVDYIKIDGSLIKNIDSDKDFKAIVQAMCTLGDILGKKIIAEYVVNESVLDVLKEIGIYYGQGYYLGEPAPLDEFIKNNC